jgi:hypothetical protein
MTRWLRLAACALVPLGCDSVSEEQPDAAAMPLPDAPGVAPDAPLHADAPLQPDAAMDHEASNPTPAALGSRCVSNADCVPGVTCLLSTGTSLGAGGPAHGYCSVPCALADDPACAAFGAKCLDFAPHAGDPPQTWCVQTCTRGGDAPSVDKCHGRPDVACTPESVTDGTPSTAGYCLPTCGSDADCAGRHCNPLLGVCTDAPASGAPTGTRCDPASGAPTGCAGVCLAVGSSAHVCADRCVYLHPSACNLPGKEIDAGIATYSACIFVSSGTGAGDEASCGQLCDVVDDCLDKNDPGVFCDTSPDALGAYGHGFCNWAATASTDGGAEGDASDAPDAAAVDAPSSDDG